MTDETLANLNAARIGAAQHGRMQAQDDKVLTDHAVLRYIERVMGLNVDAIRQELLDGDTQAMIDAGATRIHRNGYKLVIKYHRIITITK